MFLFKKKKIIVDAFTTNDYIEKFFPVAKASSFIPKWFTDTPPHYNHTSEHGAQYKVPTIKRCIGLQDLYKQGFIIPLWSDVTLTIKGDGNYAWMWADKSTVANSHAREQYSKGFNKLLHLKIHSPWIFQEKTGVNFLWNQPTWSQLDLLSSIFTPPAIVNYKYQIGTNINIFFPNTKANIDIVAGQPMAHIIPLSESPIEIKTHVISDNEMRKKAIIYNSSSSFLSKYLTNKKLMQALEK